MGCLWSKSHRICDQEEGWPHDPPKKPAKAASKKKFKQVKRNFRHRSPSKAIQYSDDPHPTSGCFESKASSLGPSKPILTPICLPAPDPVPHPTLDPPPHPVGPPAPAPPSNRGIFSSTALQLKVKEFITPAPLIDSTLKLGTLTETWKNRAEWMRFKSYLDALDEGRDSMDCPLTLGRYALFLELLVELDQADRVQNRSNEDLRALVMRIQSHPEDFFGMDRCLSCVETGMRRKVLSNCKQVAGSLQVRGGMWVFQPVYQRVLDELDMFLGNYNKTLVKQDTTEGLMTLKPQAI